MKNENNITLFPPEFPQSDSDEAINMIRIRAMDVNYLMMIVKKFVGVTVLDKIEGEIYKKDDVSAKVKSIPYIMTSDKIDDDIYILLFDVSDININGLCEAKYTIKDPYGNLPLESPTSTITLIQNSNTSNPDHVNVKVQTTKNIGGTPSEYPDNKPFLVATIYGEKHTEFNAHVTNAFFDNGANDTSVVTNENGVNYLYIYSEDINKNSVLSLNYDDSVIAYKVPLDFAPWKVSTDKKITYTYSSYGVADGICECFLFIKLDVDNPDITEMNIKFSDDAIMINGEKNTITIFNPNSKISTLRLTSNKAVHSTFTINITGINDIDIKPIENTIVFVEPIKF